MVTERDELLARVTDGLAARVVAGSVVGHEDGVSIRSRRSDPVELTWDELETSDNPAQLADERFEGAQAD